MSMSGVKHKENTRELDCNCFTKPDVTCPPVRNVTHPLRYYEFTQEEMKALEECDRESFYRRCLPFSAVLASLTYAAIKNEVMRPHPHFGVVPKVFVAMCVGYVSGRVSYLGKYDERLRRLPPTSYLGNVLRKYHAERSTSSDNKPAK